MNLRFLNSGFWVVACVTTLYCAPDPDLFDGRYSSVSSGSSTTENQASEEGAGTRSGEGNINNEGDTNSESDKDLDASNKSSSGATAGEVAEATSGKPGSGKSGSESSSAKATAPANQSARSFEEFEIGSIHEAEGQIEIRRSKEPGELPSPTAQTSDPAANSNTQNSDENAQKSSSTNQEPFQGSGGPDYGEDVPFGL